MCDCGCESACISKECTEPKSQPQFEVGDRVYSFLGGWGSVSRLGKMSVNVQFENGTNHSFYLDGKYVTYGDVVLFHDKPTIIPPKRKVKKWKWAYEASSMDGKNKSLRISVNYHTSLDPLRIFPPGGLNVTEGVKLPWTEIEVEE